jgi:hypothetical protein
MTPPRERYEKLPGQLRGVVRGASAWMGPDHLLLVRSMRVTEEYRRFYLRDVQAIVVARAPRFHLSTRCYWIAAVWLIAYGFTKRFSSPGAGLALWFAAAALIAAWIYISAAWSCRCRIYTAVSRDELPSVYRVWTARRFLDRVTPRVVEVQGIIDSNWAEAAEELVVGPPGSARKAKGLSVNPAAPSRTLASNLFVASLFASGLTAVLTLHAPVSRRWIPLVFQLLKTAAAIAVLVEFQRGMLRLAMQRVAIVALVTTGVLYYGNAVLTSSNGAAVTVSYLSVQEAGAAVSVILGLVGAALSLRPNR